MSNLGQQKGSAIGTVLGLAATYFTGGTGAAAFAAGGGLGAAVGGAAGGLLQKPKELPVLPGVLAQPDQSQIQQAQQQKVAQQLGQRGRASTILTSDNASGKLGG